VPPRNSDPDPAPPKPKQTCICSFIAKPQTIPVLTTFKRQEPVNTFQAASTYSITDWRQSTFIAMRRQEMSSFQDSMAAWTSRKEALMD
jgi:hypothetical protein